MTKHNSANGQHIPLLSSSQIAEESIANLIIVEINIEFIA